MTTHIEYQHFILPIDTNVQDELRKLIEAGWAPIPGATPVAIWHMQRMPEQALATSGVQAGISVKEEGISIIRGGGGTGPKVN